MVKLNEKAKEAAKAVYREITLPIYPIVPANHDAALAEAIRAYLSALPAPDDGLVERLRNVSNMINMGEGIRWGEETALMDQAATALQSKDEQIERLTRERDVALENYTRAWNERDAQRRRAETAEQQVQKLTAENERMREALKVSRQVLAKLLSAGHNNPPATPEEIDAAFWSVDAALTQEGEM